jgi:hypothetical protein
MRLSRKALLGILLILALSSGAAAQQSRQSQKTPGVRPNETNTQAAETTANDQQQNVRKPDVDKTNSPEAGVHIDPTSETFPQTMVGNQRCEVSHADEYRHDGTEDGCGRDEQRRVSGTELSLC